MCFVLYLGTDMPLPSIPWDEKNRHLNTEDTGENDGEVARHFSKAYTKYVGSDQRCGCGFRHVSFQNGEWPEEWNVCHDPDHDESHGDQIHRELHDFISPMLNAGSTVELYGCWDGDFGEPIEHREAITLDRLLDRKFYLRERGLYTVTRSESGGGPNALPRVGHF